MDETYSGKLTSLLTRSAKYWFIDPFIPRLKFEDKLSPDLQAPVLKKKKTNRTLSGLTTCIIDEKMVHMTVSASVLTDY